MKNNLLTVLICFFSVSVFAGSSNPGASGSIRVTAAAAAPTTQNINLKKLVSAEIETARIKQMDDPNSNSQTNIPPVVHTQPVEIQHTETQQNKVVLKKEPEKSQLEKLVSSMQMSDETTIRVSVMAFATFAAFVVVFARRKKLNVKKSKKQNYKDGIKLIREEKVKVQSNGKLSLVRNKLIGRTSAYQVSNDIVSKNARELSIAKGEIYLAARIKSHELKKAGY